MLTSTQLDKEEEEKKIHIRSFGGIVEPGSSKSSNEIPFANLTRCFRSCS